MPNIFLAWQPASWIGLAFQHPDSLPVIFNNHSGNTLVQAYPRLRPSASRRTSLAPAPSRCETGTWFWFTTSALYQQNSACLTAPAVVWCVCVSMRHVTQLLHANAAAQQKWKAFASQAFVNGGVGPSRPVIFRIGGSPVPGLCQGLQEGIRGMRVGGRRTFTVPAEAGFGNVNVVAPYAAVPAGSDLR